MGVPRNISMPQILGAAEQVFGKHGFSGATMAEIARVAQLPKANIHYYFTTKEALYKAVLEHTLTDWLADADFWISPDRSPQEALHGYVTAKLAFSRNRPDASRLFAHEILEGAQHVHAYLATTLREHVAHLAHSFTHWKRTGQMRRVDTPHFMFCLWSMTQAYADMRAQMAAVLGQKTLTETDYERAAHTILDLLLQPTSRTLEKT